MPGFLIAFWLAERYRDRFRGRKGRRGSLGNFPESIHLIRVMFAGAGILALCLPVTVWFSGAPLAVAVVGIFSYRFLALRLPMPASLALLPEVRRMGRQRVPQAAGKAEPPEEPGLRSA